MWPFGKVEWKTAMMPLEFVDDAGDLDAMMISFEAVGNPDGQTRYFSASYYFPGGDAAVAEYDKLREALRRGIENVQVEVALKFRNGRLKDFRITPESLVAATGCDACGRLEICGWGINESSWKTR